jgi:pimeloyl-ACP methyl ester carboxylesterase
MESIALPSQLLRLQTADGLSLAIEAFGDPNDPPVLFAHGFGQNRQAWRQSALSLAEQGWYGLALDGRGHGDSDWLPAGQYVLDQFAQDLRELAAVHPSSVLIGASMGGLLGLLVQGESAQRLFKAMVLVDVTPRWETAGVDRILSFMAAHPAGFDSLQHAADEVARYLPHRDRKDPERLRSQLREQPDGRWRWHWDPRLLDRVAQEAAQYIPRLQAAATRIDIPLLLLSGDRSDVVSDHTIDEFLRLVPHAEHVRIQDATHMVVGDRNDVFTREIARFLDRFR